MMCIVTTLNQVEIVFRKWSSWFITDFLASLGEFLKMDQDSLRIFGVIRGNFFGIDQNERLRIFGLVPDLNRLVTICAKSYLVRQLWSKLSGSEEYCIFVDGGV
jgi:hypothetical protein